MARFGCGDGPFCAKSPRSGGLDEAIKTGRRRGHVCRSFSRVGRGRNWKKLRVFAERNTEGTEGGWGSLKSHGPPRSARFIRCVMTRRVFPMVVPTCCRRERERREGGGSTCEAIPASTEHGFKSRYYNRHGSRGYSPIARNTTHMARPLCPSLPPPPSPAR